MLIIGIDPKMRIGGHLAIVVCTVRAGLRRCHRRDLSKLRAGNAIERVERWREALREALDFCDLEFGGPPDLLAIENARGPGGSGYQLQFLVRALSEDFDGEVALINPATAKLIQTGAGDATAERVSYFALREFGLPDAVETDDYDLGAALAVANAGFVSARSIEPGRTNGARTKGRDIDCRTGPSRTGLPTTR